MTDATHTPSLHIDPHFPDSYVVDVQPIKPQGISPAMVVHVPSLVTRLVWLSSHQLQTPHVLPPRQNVARILKAAARKWEQLHRSDS